MLKEKRLKVDMRIIGEIIEKQGVKIVSWWDSSLQLAAVLQKLVLQVKNFSMFWKGKTN